MSMLASGTIEHKKCNICGAKVTQTRRGRCFNCYNKWIESQPIAVGASCRACGERRRDNLQRVELLGRWYYFCHVCAYKAVRLEPMPDSIDGVKARLERRRRFGDRREHDLEDNRKIKRERRVGERRVVVLSEEDILYDEDLFLDYDEPIEGEATGVFQKIDKKDLEEDDSQTSQHEINLEL